MTDILAVENLAVEVSGLSALVDVNVRVRAGGSVGIVGETGSGKSLTARTAIGLLDRIGARATAGRVVFEDRDLLSLSPSEWRTVRGRRIAMVPQMSMSGLDPLMRIGRQVSEAVKVLDPDADADTEAARLLEAVELPASRGFMRSYQHELSGGMRQRVVIAMALAGSPSVLLADEPTTALDVTVQQGILSLLASLQAQAGMALVLISHDLEVVGAVSEYVFVMYAGATVESGPVRDVIENPAHPYTRALVAAQPANARSGTRLMTIQGAPPGLGERPPGCPFAPRCPHAIAACSEREIGLSEVGPGHTVACIRVREIAQ